MISGLDPNFVAQPNEGHIAYGKMTFNSLDKCNDDDGSNLVEWEFLVMGRCMTVSTPDSSTSISIYDYCTGTRGASASATESCYMSNTCSGTPSACPGQSGDEALRNYTCFAKGLTQA